MSVQATALDPRSVAAAPQRAFAWMLVGAAAYFLLGLLGRATIQEGEVLSLVWPAAGVAALWFSAGDRRTWPSDVAALSIATFVINSVTGATIRARRRRTGSRSGPGTSNGCSGWIVIG